MNIPVKKIHTAIYQIGETIIDLNNVLFPEDHPIFLCVFMSSQWKEVLIEHQLEKDAIHVNNYKIIFNDFNHLKYSATSNIVGGSEYFDTFSQAYQFAIKG